MISQDKLEQIKVALAEYHQCRKNWKNYYDQEVAKTKNHQIAAERYNMVMSEAGDKLSKEIKKIIS